MDEESAAIIDFLDDDDGYDPTTSTAAAITTTTTASATSTASSSAAVLAAAAAGTGEQQQHYQQQQHLTQQGSSQNHSHNQHQQMQQQQQSHYSSSAIEHDRSAPRPSSASVSGDENATDGRGGGMGFAARSILNANKEIESKMFVGALHWDTTEETLRGYFSKYGEILDAVIMLDPVTGRSRSFGFVIFKDAHVLEHVLSLKHVLDDRNLEVKRAVPRPSVQTPHHSQGPSSNSYQTPQARSDKIFIGGLMPTTTESALRSHFAPYGDILECVLMVDRATGRPRGFGFVTFEKSESVDSVMRDADAGGVLVEGRSVEVRRAVPKGGPGGGGGFGGPGGGIGRGVGREGMGRGRGGGYYSHEDRYDPYGGGSYRGRGRGGFRDRGR
ncbi:hypothetical protein DFJ73DRAFT_643320, partial [Zopfochytrium polystomum]